MPIKIACKCGSTMFQRDFYVSGVWQTVVQAHKDGSLEVIDTDLDELASRKQQPKFMRCSDCKKRVPNPDYKP